MIFSRSSARYFALVLAFPADAIATRQLNLAAYFFFGFHDRAAQIAAAHAVLDGDIALVSFAVNFGAAIPLFDLAKLRQRDAFPGRSQQADVFDRFLRVAELREIAQHQIVALFALQYLGERIASRGGVDGILNVGYVDLIARGRLAIDHEVVVRLPEHPEDSQIRDSGDLAHDVHGLLGFFLKNVQVVAVDLGGKLPLDAADRFFHVVGDRLREAPDHSGQLVQLFVHGGDDFVLVLVKAGPPLLLGLQIGEVLGIEEAGGIGSVVRTPGLAGALGHFGKRTKDESRLIHEPDAFGGSGAGSQRAAHPQRAFIQMRQEFGADHAAERQVDDKAKTDNDRFRPLRNDNGRPRAARAGTPG